MNLEAIIPRPRPAFGARRSHRRQVPKATSTCGNAASLALAPLTIALLLAAFAGLSSESASAADSIYLVVPNDFTNQMAGGCSSVPFSTRNSLRSQHCYGASEFSAIRPRGGWITRIGFRPASIGNGLSADIPSLQVNFSTTAKAPHQLSLVYADNVGADETIVFGPAPRDMSTAPANLYWSPKLALPLTKPFFYSPTNGNLLMDVFNYEGSLEEGGCLDTASINQGYPLSHVLGSWPPDNYDPALFRFGFVTRFEIIPAPPEPPLGIGRSEETALLSWPSNAVDFVLESTTTLLSSNQWTAVTNVPVVVNTNYTLTTTLSGTSQFYRLRYVLRYELKPIY